jgi:hypothetical protein
MPGIVPKNISTRQSGQITNVTQMIGNPKSSGSIKRIEKTCPECVDVFFKPPVLKPLFDEYDKPYKLFDIESFDKMDIEIESMNKQFDDWNPNKVNYKSALLYAANRWMKLINLYFPTVFFFRKLMKDGGWKGIYLAKVFFTYEKPEIQTIATCDPLPHIYEQSSFVKGFNLLINLTKMNNYQQQSVGNILTHELGHALGITLWNVYKNGTVSSEVLNLPMLDITQKHNFWHCLAYRWPEGGSLRIGHANAVSAYNLYGGSSIPGSQTIGAPLATIKESNINSSEKLTVALRNARLPLALNDMFHFRQTPIYVDNGIFNPDIIFRGIYNDIMVPYYNPQVQYFITNISIGYLLDMGTWYGDEFYQNYSTVLGGGSDYDGSEVTGKPEIVNDVLHFTGVALEHTKKSNDKGIYNIEPESELVCNCCNLNNNK